MKVISLYEIEHTQGTVQLINHGKHLHVKKGSDLTLVPQPNVNDPNDPLTWPLRKRLAAFYSVLFFSALCNFCITGLSPGFEQLAVEFGSSISQLTYLISVTGLGQGMGCYTIAPLAIRFGKRPIWLFCIFGFFICNIWAAASQSYPSLLVARLLATWAAGASEPLSIDTLNDLFFLHERGTQTGVQAVWLSLGSSVAPVICGFLIQSKGWRWYHWLVSIMAGVNVLLIFFLVPETQYRRDLHKSLDATGADPDSSGDEESNVAPNQSDRDAELKPGVMRVETKASTVAAGTALARKKYLEEIKPWSGIQKDTSLLAAYMRPWALWAYPSMIWAVCAFSLHVSCVVVLISLLPLEIGAPPYNFSISQQGLTFIAPCIGNIFAAFCCGYLNDILGVFSARRNHGVFEPEMRLPVVAIPALLVPAGLAMFGVGVAKRAHWIVPVVGDGLVAVGLTGIASVAQPYLMDSYFPVSMDALITFNGFKNFVSFGIGFSVIPWVERAGLISVFCILAALVFVIDASAGLLYIFGKRLRARDGRLKIFVF